MKASIPFALLLALGALGNAHADSSVRPPSRLGLCASCHGRHGMAVIPGAPNLAGQKYGYLLHAMHQYRDGQRDVPVMRAALGPLSEPEIEALAHWYAGQSPAQPRKEAGH